MDVLSGMPLQWSLMVVLLAILVFGILWLYRENDVLKNSFISKVDRLAEAVDGLPEKVGEINDIAEDIKRIQKALASIKDASEDAHQKLNGIDPAIKETLDLSKGTHSRLKSSRDDHERIDRKINDILRELTGLFATIQTVMSGNLQIGSTKALKSLRGDKHD